MRLQEVRYIRKPSGDYRKDIVLGERPNDPLTADDYIGGPFDVLQSSARILYRDVEVPEGQTHGRQEEFWRCKRTRGDKIRTFVYDNSYGCGIPTRYFIEV